MTVVSSSAVKPGLATATTGGWVAASSATGPARSARSGRHRATHHPRPVSVSCGSTRPAVTSRMATEYAAPSHPTDAPTSLPRASSWPSAASEATVRRWHITCCSPSGSAIRTTRIEPVCRGRGTTECRADDRLQIAAVDATARLPGHDLAIEPGQLQPGRRTRRWFGWAPFECRSGVRADPGVVVRKTVAKCRICGILPIRTTSAARSTAGGRTAASASCYSCVTALVAGGAASYVLSQWQDSRPDAAALPTLAPTTSSTTTSTTTTTTTIPATTTTTVAPADDGGSGRRRSHGVRRRVPARPHLSGRFRRVPG